MRPSYIQLYLASAALLALCAVSADKIESSSFAASKAIPVSAIQSSIQRASKTPNLATYPVSIGENSVTSTIHDDWASFSEGAAFVWVADMDVDCDGLAYGCKGNLDGQPLTNWGALAAYEVPFIVIPDAFQSAHEDLLPGNNVAAVICNNKMYYGILGDTNSNNPQVTGEASWLLARACFPNDNLDGSKGHTAADVTYILFTGKDAVLPENAMNKNYITDFKKLKSMGDRLVGAFVRNMGLKKLGDDGHGHEEEGKESAAWKKTVLSRFGLMVTSLVTLGVMMSGL